MSEKINIKANKIEIIKNWSKPKSIQDILVFIGFASFYWQFIQSFSRIITPLISILKITGLPNKPAPDRNNSSKLAFNKNNNSRLAFKKNNNNNEFDEFGDNNMEYAKKLKKSKDKNCLSHKNYLNHKNQKVKNWLCPKTIKKWKFS